MTTPSQRRNARAAELAAVAYPLPAVDLDALDRAADQIAVLGLDRSVTHEQAFGSLRLLVGGAA